MDTSFNFKQEQFDRLFPYYVLVDRQLRVLGHGRSLAKISGICAGANFPDYFTVKRPEVGLNSLDILIRLQNQLVVLENTMDKTVVLRGQFEYLAEKDCVLFVGSPWFGSMDQVRERNLSLHDFAYHDPLIDLLHVLKTQEIVNEDIKNLLTTVNKQRNELRKLSMIAEQSANAVTITDPSGNIEWVNHAFSRITGYTFEEAKGRKPGVFLQGPGTDPDTVAYIRNQLSQRLPFHCEILNYSKTGTPYWIRLDGQPIRDKAGKVIQYFAFQEDITRQKALEVEIKTSVSRMSTLIGNLHAGILLEDHQRRIQLVNQQFCTMFGIPQAPEQLVGQDCSQYAQLVKSLFAEPAQFVARVNDILETCQPAIGDQLALADGRVFERDFIPIWSENTYQGHLWVYADITEKTRAQKTIQDSEEKYRGIIENMELGLLEVDLHQTILRSNQAFCDMMGYSEKELIGQNAVAILLPEKSHSTMLARDQERKSGRSSVYEIQIRRKDGSLLWVLLSGAPIKNSQGEVVGSIGIHFDLSSRKKLEHQLAEAKQVAEKARLAERHFLANMSHEIRTPMNAVIGMTHLLYETQPTPHQKEYLDSLRFSADLLMGLIDNILDLSKIEAGELELDERPFDLRQLLLSLQRSFQYRVRDKAISVVVHLDPAISNLLIGDPTRLGQILNNLLGNASKFTERGTIGVDTLLLSQNGQTCAIEFRVFDTGIGIPVDRQSDVFDYFKQADVQIHRKFGGTGLGLTIVKQLVELQGGTIRVESEPGKGSTFIFSIPYRYSKQQAALLQPKPEISSQEALALLRKTTVLIVEDNSMNQKLLSRMFDNWGCAYQMASNGLEALQLAHQKRFDVILMDIHMPEMDGCEASMAIRQDLANPNRHTPIIALTAAALQEERKRALESGMNAFLTKPFSPQMLQESMLSAMGLDAGEQADEQQDLSAPAPVEIDFRYLEELSGGDQLFIRDMIETYLAETPPALDGLQNTLQTEDWDQVYRIVHKLKPNFGMLGMKSLEEQAQRIEARIKAGQTADPELPELVSALEARARTSFPVLQQKLAGGA